jgi:hypothetical protein
MKCLVVQQTIPLLLELSEAMAFQVYEELREIVEEERDEERRKARQRRAPVARTLKLHAEPIGAGA